MKPKERVVVEQFRKILHTKCRFLLNTTYNTRFTAEWTSYSYLWIWIWICVKSGLIYFRSSLNTLDFQHPLPTGFSSAWKYYMPYLHPKSWRTATNIKGRERADS